MNAIFPIFAIFILVLILFFLSQIVVKIIWEYKAKFNSTKTIEYLGSAIALIFLFIIFLLAVVSATNIFVTAEEPAPSDIEEVKLIDNSLNLEDCRKLIDEIYLGESQIYKLENHRYLEIVSTSNNINLNYRKGARKLRLIAEQYLKLDLNPEAISYSQIIADKLQKKAQLFEQRIDFIIREKEQQKVSELLDKMDIVTQERLNAIASVEDQCNSK